MLVDALTKRGAGGGQAHVNVNEAMGGTNTLMQQNASDNGICKIKRNEMKLLISILKGVTAIRRYKAKEILCWCTFAFKISLHLQHEINKTKLEQNQNIGLETVMKKAGCV